MSKEKMCYNPCTNCRNPRKPREDNLIKETAIALVYVVAFIILMNVIN